MQITKIIIVNHFMIHHYEDDLVFCRSGDRPDKASVKNAIAKEIHSQVFILGLLIENAIAFSLRMRSPSLIDLVRQC
jgi:hypothetical protein